MDFERNALVAQANFSNILSANIRFQLKTTIAIIARCVFLMMKRVVRSFSRFKPNCQFTPHLSINFNAIHSTLERNFKPKTKYNKIEGNRLEMFESNRKIKSTKPNLYLIKVQQE